MSASAQTHHPSPLVDTPPATLSLMDAKHPRRSQAQQLIQQIYQRAYNARIRSFYPYLLSLENSPGRFDAVAGIRPAGDQPLFSEQYLDCPIESLLPTTRGRIVEIGNLAPSSPGQVRQMIAMITAFLHGAGFEQVVFTAVPLVHNAFRRLGLKPQWLANARPERLRPNQDDDWGCYYQQQPGVYSGNVAFGFHRLRQHYQHSIIWREALKMGRKFEQLR